ncbi:MAG TPA: DUF3108 domain-containing protein [Ramlibacter sp.]|nr:DUF3108 domain-containing protein [Ramlibacter sp.]
MGTQPFITRSVASQPPSGAAVVQPAALRPRPAVAAQHTIERVSSSTFKARAGKTTAAAANPPPLGELTPAAAPAAAPVPQPAARLAAFTIPHSMRLHYQVTALVRRQTWSGEGELVWHHDGESYEATLQISAPLLPARTQHSTGKITAEGLAPLRFSDRSRSEQAAHFERDKGKVSFSSNTPDAPLLAGAQDRLSVMLQLGAMIAGEPAKFPPATTISIQTASTREAEPWLFTVEREEELQLPGGKVSGLKLTRNPRREFDQKIELWLAPGMDYVPVRLRLTQPNGDSVDQQWSSTDRG